MARRLATVFVLVVAVALAGAAVAAPAALGPPDGETATTAYPAVTADLGVATGAGDAGLRAAFDQAALEHRLANASASAREDELEAHLGTLEEELEELDAREQAAIEDEVDVRELLRVHARAEARLGTLPDLREHLATGSADDPAQHPAALEGRYRLHTGPVRAAMLGAIRGEGRLDPRLDRHASGYTLSATHGGGYLREAVRFDRWSANGTEDAAAAIQRVAEAYPETTGTTAAVHLGDGRYLVERTAPTGTVAGYVAGEEGTIAAERQRHRVERLSVETEVDTTEEGLVVGVRGYGEERPLRITVERASDGAPVDARVFLRYDTTWTAVGTTGSEGRHWSVTPPGSFAVRVVGPEGGIATVEVG